jgi:hypothetical protein
LPGIVTVVSWVRVDDVVDDGTAADTVGDTGVGAGLIAPAIGAAGAATTWGGVGAAGGCATGDMNGIGVADRGMPIIVD